MVMKKIPWWRLSKMIADEEEGYREYMGIFKNTGIKAFKSMAKDEAKHKRMLEGIIKGV